MKRLPGELKSTNPKNLIDPSIQNDLDDFFLVLALVFNDLKGLILLDSTFREVYETLLNNEVSVHSGEYNGIRIQIHRLLIGQVSEFFVFLGKNTTLINSLAFKLILKKITQEDIKSWTNLVSVNTKLKNDDSFFSKLARIRNNLAFHYNSDSKEIAKSFKKKFFEEEKNPGNLKAYFSLGNNMETTRFDYCDALINSYLVEHLKTNSSGTENYQEILLKSITEMSSTINQLLRAYFKFKNIK